MNEQEEPQPAQSSEEGAQEPKLHETKGRRESLKAYYRDMNTRQQEQNTPVQQEACLNCESLTAQLNAAEQKVKDLDSQYRRLAADFENYRKRIDREREDFIGFGVQRVVEALLPALDDMDRAMNNLSVETDPEKLLESLRLVYDRITCCLEQVGVKTLKAEGEHFDPRFHQPVQQILTTEFPDGSVIHELRKGYTLLDKVIRPALVNVASNHPSSEGQNMDLPKDVNDVADDLSNESEG